MCIRDRYRDDNANALTRCVIDFLNLSGHMAERINCTGRYICLLYTSDAADDLLCVDLGGRRLIKKKKTKQHHTIPYNASITRNLTH